MGVITLRDAQSRQGDEGIWGLRVGCRWCSVFEHLCLQSALPLKIHRQTIRARHSESPRPRLHDVSSSLFPLLQQIYIRAQRAREERGGLCAASCSPLCCLFVRPPANHNSSLQPNLNCEVPLRKPQCRSQRMPASAIAWRRTEGRPHRCDCCHAVSTAAASAAAMSSPNVRSPEMSRVLSSSSPRSPAQSTSQGKSLSVQPGAKPR